MDWCMGMKKMSNIVCPKCGVVTTDRMFDNGDENVSWRTNDKGNIVYQCFECEYEWEEELGEKDD